MQRRSGNDRPSAGELRLVAGRRNEVHQLLVTMLLNLRPEELTFSSQLQYLKGRVSAELRDSDLPPQVRKSLFKFPKSGHRQIRISVASTPNHSAKQRLTGAMGAGDSERLELAVAHLRQHARRRGSPPLCVPHQERVVVNSNILPGNGLPIPRGASLRTAMTSSKRDIRASRRVVSHGGQSLRRTIFS